MANLVLIYGMRLLPSEEVEQIGDALIKLKNGRDARVTMHVLEGSKEAIEKQDLTIQDGTVLNYRVRLGISFKYDPE